MIAKFGGRLLVSKETVQNLDVWRFSLKNPWEVEVRKKYQIKFSNML
jgi:hypothetical protein